MSGLLEKPHTGGAKTPCAEFPTPSSPLHEVVTVASAPQPPVLFSGGSIKSLCDLSTVFMLEELPSIMMSTDEVSRMVAATIRHDMF